MLIKVMDKLNNHFVKSVEYAEFEITTSSIKGTFNEVYLVGMYLLIKDSYLNDGIYKITNVVNDEITLDKPLTAESIDESIRVYACSPPADFIELVTKIENYNEVGIGTSSESIDDYSANFGDGDGSWQSVYENKLNQYRCVYADLMIDKNFRWQDRLS